MSVTPMMAKYKSRLHTLAKKDPLAKVILQLVESTGGNIPNLAFALPSMFNWDGVPFSLQKHQPWEILFDTMLPSTFVARCARQVGKSLQNAVQIALQTSWIPYWNTLYLTPYYEMIRRFSTIYLGPLIETSPIKSIMRAKKGSNQVLQRSFASGGVIHLSYACTDATRTRGINAHQLKIDEAQLVIPEVLPVVQNTMSGSRFGRYYQSFLGTPIAFGTLLEQQHAKSTQSEWAIPCKRCGKENIPTVAGDLLKMSRPPKRDISYERPALVCAKCGHFLWIEDGFWLHKYPERRYTNLGIHIPQLLMQNFAYSFGGYNEYYNAVNSSNKAKYLIYNEHFGEPCDSGFRLISEDELRSSATLGPMRFEWTEPQLASRYMATALGIDWGGGGADGTSTTAMSVIGITPTGKLEVIYGFRSRMSYNRAQEAAMAIKVAQKFNCSIIAHDVMGMGLPSEQMMIQAGVPMEMIWPMAYQGPVKGEMLSWIPPYEDQPRGTFKLDKSRSLYNLFEAIKKGFVHFFDFGGDNSRSQDLLKDFLSMEENISYRVFGNDVRLITRTPTLTDDFAHAVNFAAAALWGKYQAWPNLGASIQFVTPDQLAVLLGDGDVTEEQLEEALNLAV